MIQMPSSTSSATPSKVTEHAQPLASEQEKLTAEAEFRTTYRAVIAVKIQRFALTNSGCVEGTATVAVTIRISGQLHYFLPDILIYCCRLG